MTTANANIKCPCGQQLQVPFIGGAGGEYDIMGVKCPKCGRIAGSGNTRTGQVTSWMTPAQVNSANADYQEQLFSADMNEFYGRGNW
jgi:hypothetical protein